MKKVKRLLAVLLSAAMVITLTPTMAFADETQGAGTGQSFSDTNGHWATSAINEWNGYGVVQGSDGQFRPNDSISRAELAQIVCNLLQLPEQSGMSFSDVGNEWYAGAVAKVSAMGIMQGSDGNFRPNDKITRQEAMVTLGRALGIEPVTNTSLSSFTDGEKVADWASGYVAALTEKGFVSGMGNGSVAPLANINRASVVTILSNSVDVYANTPGSTVTAGSSKGIVIVVADNVTVKGNVSENVIVSGTGDGQVTIDAAVSGNVVNTTDATVEISENASVSGNVTSSGEGGVKNEGTVSGAIETASGDVENSGTAGSIATEGGAVENSGTTGNISTEGGAVTNSGTAASIETGSGAVENSGTAANIETESGAVTNSGTATSIETGSGAVTNSGKVEGAVSSTSGDVSNSGTIAGDVTTTSGNVTNDKGATIGGDVTSTSGSVANNGTVSGDVSGNTTSSNKTTTTTGGGGGGSSSSDSSSGSSSSNNTSTNTSTSTAVKTAWVRPAGPAGDEESYDYAAAYKNLGIDVEDGTDENNNTVKINVSGAALAAANVPTELTHAGILYVGIQFDTPSDALYAKDGNNSNGVNGVIDLSTDESNQIGGKYVEYFRIAEVDENGKVTKLCDDVFGEDNATNLTVNWYADEECTTPASIESTKFTVVRTVTYADQDAPTLESLVVGGDADGEYTISGVSTDMEYSSDAGITYVPCTGEEITGLNKANYLVRYAARIGYNASAAVTVNVPELKDRADLPNVTGAALSISGTDTSMQYKKSDAGDDEYENCTEGSTKVDIAGTYYVRYKADDEFKASETVTVIVTELPKPDAPSSDSFTVSGEEDNYTISGVTTAMEYSSDNGGSYTPCTGADITSLRAGTYLVRYAKTEDSQASDPVEVEVPAGA